MPFHVHTCIYIYRYILVYIYTWALPQRCSVEGSHSQSNVVATLHSIGQINKGIRDYVHMGLSENRLSVNVILYHPDPIKMNIYIYS